MCCEAVNPFAADPELSRHQAVLTAKETWVNYILPITVKLQLHTIQSVTKYNHN